MLEPFNRLIEGDQLMAYKYEGFWRAMDTLRDRQVLEDMVEQGEMPWRIRRRGSRGAAGYRARAQKADSMRTLPLAEPGRASRFSASARIRTISRSAPAARSSA